MNAQAAPYPFFGYQKGERLNFAKPRGEGITIRLSPLERKILAVVDTCLITTVNLLARLLEQLGWHENITGIRASLEKLFQNKYLVKMEFANSQRSSAPKIFALGKKGKEYIKALGKTPNAAKWISAPNAEKVKAHLSALQYLIREGNFAQAREVMFFAAVTELVKPGYHAECSFRAHALMQTREGYTQIVAVVREAPYAVEALLETLSGIEQAASGACQLNIPICDPRVVVLCETHAHQKQVEAALEQNVRSFDFPLCLTNDEVVGMYAFGNTGKENACEG